MICAMAIRLSWSEKYGMPILRWYEWLELNDYSVPVNK